jgi:hypothetical protein
MRRKAKMQTMLKARRILGRVPARIQQTVNEMY